MGKITVTVDAELVDKCMKATGIKTRKALVERALRELLLQEKNKGLLALKGKIHWEGDLNSWRRGRFED